MGGAMALKSSLNRVLILALGVVAGLTIGIGYGHVQTRAVQKAGQAKIREITQRLSQVQRRCTADRTTCEDENLAVQAEAEKLRKEKEQLAAENKTLKTGTDSLTASKAALEKKHAASEARAALLESKNGQLTEGLARTEADRHALEQKQRETFQTLQEREKDLKALNRKYDQAAEHNARLCTICDELIRKYESKGVMKTLLTKEPFTQIKKVELEKFVQDYKDKIDQQKLRSK
jgi:chromosome segregation ATPase